MEYKDYTDYSNAYKAEEEKIKEEIFEEMEPNPEASSLGKINYSSVNIRTSAKKEPNNVLTIAHKDDVVEILDMPDDTWYEVLLESGLTGYCMQEFITLL